MEHKVVIWQNAQDSDMYHIGITDDNIVAKVWTQTTISADGIFDTFGSDIYDIVAEKVHDDLVEITLSMEFVEDSDA